MATRERVRLTGGDAERRHILVLDGGGVRGLSSLVILRELLSKVDKHVRLHTGNDQVSLKPHDIFHLIIGTSTGGLIALMIGKLGMSLDECINTYICLSKTIFREGRHLRGKISWGMWRERYSDQVLSREITRLFDCKERKANELMTNKEYAHAAVVCNTKEALVNGSHGVKPVFICTHPCEGIRCTVGDAGRATSAAPTYFKPQRVTRYTQEGQQDMFLIDGGIRFNNPSCQAWFHYRGDKKHKEESELKWYGSRLLSIGTGRYDGKTFPPPKRTRLQRWIHVPSAIQLIRDASTDPELAARQMEVLSETEDIEYHRFSATTGVCWVKMDDYRRLEELVKKTQEYLSDPEVGKKINRCALGIARDYVMRLPPTPTTNGNG